MALSTKDHSSNLVCVMITKLHVKNFKSFTDFDIEGMGPRVYLIGLNGAGKTTFLQLLEFMSALMRGNGRDWSIGDHAVSLRDVLSAGSPKKTIELDATVRIGDGEYRWEIACNAQEGSVTFERIGLNGSELLSYRDKILHVHGQKSGIPLTLFGSALAAYEGNDALNRLRSCIAGIRGIGVLNPMAIAAPGRDASGKVDIDDDGRNLPVVLGRLDSGQRQEYEANLRRFYGDTHGLPEIQVRRSQYGWRRLVFTELKKTLEAIHLSYGALRYMVIAALKYSPARILFIDEIENGLSQEGMQALADLLGAFNGKQLFITTHSVLFLNYLSDEQARDGVFLLQRRPDGGGAIARRFFRDVPGQDIVLQHLNPGEAVSMTNLRDLPLPSTSGSFERP